MNNNIILLCNIYLVRLKRYLQNGFNVKRSVHPATFLMDSILAPPLRAAKVDACLEEYAEKMLVSISHSSRTFLIY